MATSSARAQEVFLCDLCGNSSLRFCNSCQVNLCLSCVGKHVGQCDSLSHDIVPYRNRKLQLVYPECEFHAGHRCEVICVRCKTPVCVICCIKQHRGHQAEELAKWVASRRRHIQMKANQIETELLPKYQARDVEIQNKISEITKEFDKLKREQNELRKLWHEEVDSIFDKIDSMINTKEKDTMATLKTYLLEIKSVLPLLVNILQENKQILKSKEAFDVVAFKPKLIKHPNIPTNINVKVPTMITDSFREGKICVSFLDVMATLTLLTRRIPEISFSPASDLLKKVIVVATFPTNCKTARKVACIESEAWISGDERVIKRFNSLGSIQTMATAMCQDWPDDISITRKGELIYTDCIKRTVNIHKNGAKETLITTPTGWRPYGLASCHKSTDFLVSVHRDGKNKIIRYHGQNITQEIDQDENGASLFKDGQYSLHMTENTNEDVCVSDLNAGIVLAVDRTGRVRFRYNGKPARIKREFDPRGLVSDSLGRIIVTDMNNDCLHILDQNGRFLKCIDYAGIYAPCAVSIDGYGRLWVGLYTGEINVVAFQKRNE